MAAPTAYSWAIPGISTWETKGLLQGKLEPKEANVAGPLYVGGFQKALASPGSAHQLQSLTCLQSKSENFEQQCWPNLLGVELASRW